MKNRPPRIAEILLRFFLRNEEWKNRLWDFEEVFDFISGDQGKFHACKWYWLQVIRSIPELIINLIYWGGIMFKNYFKIAVRNLRKQKGFSFINVTGLAVGMACCVFIFMYVQGQL